MVFLLCYFTSCLVSVYGVMVFLSCYFASCISLWGDGVLVVLFHVLYQSVRWWCYCVISRLVSVCEVMVFLLCYITSCLVSVYKVMVLLCYFTSCISLWGDGVIVLFHVLYQSVRWWCYCVISRLVSVCEVMVFLLCYFMSCLVSICEVMVFVLCYFTFCLVSTKLLLDMKDLTYISSKRHVHLITSH